MPARNNAASIGGSKRRNREAEPLGASASLEATDQKRSPYRPVSASREPVSGAIGSVTSGVRVCTGKSMMKHGETKQSQQSPLLTPGAPGANTDGHNTAFFNIDRLPSSPGDEKSSTRAPYYVMLCVSKSPSSVPLPAVARPSDSRVSSCPTRLPVSVRRGKF